MAVDEAVTVATYESGAPSALSALAGELVIDRNCVHVMTEGGALALPVFLHTEVEWTGDGLKYFDESYVEGDSISLAGGNFPLERLIGVSIPAECSDVPTFIVGPS